MEEQAYSNLNVDAEKGSSVENASKIEASDSSEKNDKPPETAKSEKARELAKHNDTREGYHRLLNAEPGESQVELMAQSIEKRRDERAPITLSARIKFLKLCRAMAETKNYSNTNELSADDIHDLHDQVQDMINRQNSVVKTMLRIGNFFGIKSDDQYLIGVMEKAEHVINSEQPKGDDTFHFRDFHFYHTKLESRYPLARSSLLKNCIIVFLFFFFTPIVFCLIAQDDGVCPEDPTDYGRWYYGWMSSLYFASTTLSSVGYGDLTVSKDERWQLLLGTIYMIISVLVMAVCVSSVVEESFKTLNGSLYQRVYQFLVGEDRPNEFIYKKIKRMRRAIYCIVVLQFTLLNVLGLVVAMLYVIHDKTQDIQWTWMTGLYWAVQTTTTIGYGDLEMPFEMRWFQILYLLLSTYFVASAVGRLGGVESEIDQERRLYFWKRRPLSKATLKDIKPLWSDGNESVDQYEFVLGSLLQLKKIDAEDVRKIMDKYREMAGASGDPSLLCVEDVAEDEDNNSAASLDELQEEMKHNRFRRAMFGPP